LDDAVINVSGRPLLASNLAAWSARSMTRLVVIG
jgi:hypothetical protein